jgi:hypothetical protein
MPKGEIPTLLWLIDGTDGQIRIEVSLPTGSVPHVYPPVEVFLNGQAIDLSTENTVPPFAAAWKAFAENKKDMYPTLSDAVMLKQHLDAIKQGVVSGGKVLVASV